MEQIKHIKNISIENFKCFDYFSVEGFGRFNIILGNNNVGKTSFLEGLLFDENIIQTISNLQGVLQSRRITYDNEIDFDTINPLSFFINKLQKDNRIKVTISYENGKKFNATYQTQQLADIEEDVRKELTN
ncbi:AAA family ATPase, partial [Flavobacterium sp.]